MKYSISNTQLFFMMVLATLSGGILLLIGGEARQDAWISILFSMVFGVLQILMYTFLFSEYPKDTVITYMPKILGRYLGNVICFLFIIRFIYLSGRLLRDNINVIITSVIPYSSLYGIALLLILPTVVSVLYGIENFFRIGELIFFTFMLFLFGQYILVFITGDVVHFGNLQPILEKGMQPIIKQAFPDQLIFPFGTNVLFAMFFPYLNKPEKVHNTVVSATIFTGLTLTLNVIIIISVLGVDYALTSISPFLDTIRHVKVGFVDRIDILSIILIVLSGFIKTTVSIFAAVIAARQFLNFKKESKGLIIVISVIVYFTAIFSGSNYMKHIYIGLKVVPIYVFQLYVTVPIIAVIVHCIKKRFLWKKGA